jgi:hypothetical protein
MKAKAGAQEKQYFFHNRTRFGVNETSVPLVKARKGKACRQLAQTFVLSSRLSKERPFVCAELG